MPNTKRATSLTDADEAEIVRRAESDPDNPPATLEQLAHPMTMAEALPELAAAAARKAGRPRSEDPKVHVSLRLSRDVLDHYRATGRGWQGRMDADLRKMIVIGQPSRRQR